jgi:hypothetical protein
MCSFCVCWLVHSSFCLQESEIAGYYIATVKLRKQMIYDVVDLTLKLCYYVPISYLRMLVLHASSFMVVPERKDAGFC